MVKECKKIVLRGKKGLKEILLLQGSKESVMVEGWGGEIGRASCRERV